MADEIITRQRLVDAGLDAESLQKFISGTDIEDVLTRLGQIYPTLAKLVRMLMETGGWKGYETEAILLATTPLVNPSVGYAFDTKKLYLWNGTNWIDEGLSQLDQAKAFANANPNFKAASFSNAFDFDLQLTMGQYDVGTSALNGSTHKPPFDVGGILIVEGSGKDYFARQRFCTIDNQEAVRTKKDVWGAWDVVIKAGDLKAKPITAPIDFNTFKKPDTYTITTVILLQCTNRPPVNAGGVFEVKGTGADYLTAHVFRSYDNIDVSRTFKTTWGAWDLHIKASDLKPKVVSSAIDFNAFNLPGSYSITNNVLATCSNGPPTPNGGIFQNIGTGAAYYTHREYVSFKGEFFKQSLETTWGPWKKLATTDITDNLAAKIAAIQTPSTGLTGKKWLAVGDSITVGLNATKSYADVLAERYSATLTKHATSGAWISAGTGTIAIPNILSQTYTSLPDSANFDFITIAAGTNDRINGTDGNLGVFDDRTTSTFYGALHTLIAGLKTKYPNARMLFMSQTPRSGLRTNPSTPTDLDKKFKAITEVCDYYAVPVFAGHKCFDFHPDDNATFKSTYMPDGLHPSDAGHIWYANRLEQAILSNAK
ncbi:SGNH/GDSL hydrolase family protein [Acinetobacter baumannii]|uniref:SGNH/GDSL hydrolase family protein n=1 Tax=Acinetobacter baumannii TaxID=470 RepID=UPI002223730D|nr:SGNH/GDSL hydrolase family protein [Acinetobacter baumannii]MCW1517828.1 SGNH/GDSL hydrolase family protein [Acinetobacter baumannii]